MPTVPRRPAAQQERDRLQAHRLHAAELFTAGVPQAQVARQLQRPKRRATERDQAAIDRWVKERWPRILQTPNGAEPAWKKTSMAAALCYGVRGGGTQLAFHITAGNDDTDTLIEVLGELRRFLGGEKATLLWDGLPAHRSTAMGRWLNSQRFWLLVEHLPAYAPS